MGIYKHALMWILCGGLNNISFYSSHSILFFPQYINNLKNYFKIFTKHLSGLKVLISKLKPHFRKKPIYEFKKKIWYWWDSSCFFPTFCYLKCGQVAYMIPQTDFCGCFHAWCVSATITKATNIAEGSSWLRRSWGVHLAALWDTWDHLRYFWQNVVSLGYGNLHISLYGEFWKVLKAEVYISVRSSQCPYEIINSRDNLIAINQKWSHFFSGVLLTKQAILSFYSEC